MPLTFHHFSRKGYSLFAALGHEVRIGVLSAATLATAAPCLGAPSTMAEGAESDSLRSSHLLDEATVSAASLAPLASDVAARQVMTFSRDDIAAAGVTSIPDLLKLCAGVDIRQRGPHGVQADISMGGGTFDQVTILLNGVNISSPHTGHLSADLPVSPADILRVEVLEGAAARVYGTQAFTGAINIVTRSPQAPLGGEVRASGGQYGYMEAGGRIALHGHALSADYTRSSGATEHSAFQSSKLYYQGRLRFHDALQADFQLGYSNKPYDANTFYGAGSLTQWERNERWIASASLRAQASRLHIEPTISWSRSYDHYQWIKHSNVGENLHRVDVLSANLKNWIAWQAGTTAFNVEARNEGILSTKLGEPLATPVASHGSNPAKYTNGLNRTNLSAHLEHNVVLQHWTISAGLLANLNTALDHRWRFYPGADLSWRPHRHWTLSGTWDMALRMPTFTDLYYKGKNIEGNSHLRPERTQDATLKLLWRRPTIVASLAATYSHRTDMIDWTITQAQADGVYRSSNYQLDNVGIRGYAAFHPRERWKKCPLRSLSVQYAWLHGDIDYPEPILSSLYAMEYLRHKLVVSADGRLWRNLALSLAWRWQQRTGPTADAYSLVDAHLSWHQPIPRAKHLACTLFIDGHNILGHKYTEYSYVQQPGRWVTGGFTLHF